VNEVFKINNDLVMSINIIVYDTNIPPKYVKTCDGSSLSDSTVEAIMNDISKEVSSSKSLKEYVEHRVQTADLAELKEFMREQLVDYYSDWDEEELESIGIINNNKEVPSE
jgi:hypothetical protein